MPSYFILLFLLVLTDCRPPTGEDSNRCQTAKSCTERVHEGPDGPFNSEGCCKGSERGDSFCIQFCSDCKSIGGDCDQTSGAGRRRISAASLIILILAAVAVAVFHR